MSFSIVVNTAALGPRAENVIGSGGRAAPHSWRAYALRNFILPYYAQLPFVEKLIVVGEWEEGEGYTYLHDPSVSFDCCDALHQRQRGFEATDSEIILFQHDDHILDLRRPVMLGSQHVISPARWTRLRGRAERVNGGEPGWCQKCRKPGCEHDIRTGGYISGHAAIYHRSVLEKCPWGHVANVYAWDMWHTKQIVGAGFSVCWDEYYRVWDVERGSTPWV